MRAVGFLHPMAEDGRERDCGSRRGLTTHSPYNEPTPESLLKVPPLNPFVLSLQDMYFGGHTQTIADLKCNCLAGDQEGTQHGKPAGYR
jgi:hypothetical protein